MTASSSVREVEFSFFGERSCDHTFFQRLAVALRQKHASPLRKLRDSAQWRCAYRRSYLAIL
jgi:hypothetical protein